MKRKSKRSRPIPDDIAERKMTTMDKAKKKALELLLDCLTPYQFKDHNDVQLLADVSHAFDNPEIDYNKFIPTTTFKNEPQIPYISMNSAIFVGDKNSSMVLECEQSSCNEKGEVGVVAPEGDGKNENAHSNAATVITKAKNEQCPVTDKLTVNQIRGSTVRRSPQAQTRRQGGRHQWRDIIIQKIANKYILREFIPLAETTTTKTEPYGIELGIFDNVEEALKTLRKLRKIEKENWIQSTLQRYSALPEPDSAVPCRVPLAALGSSDSSTSIRSGGGSIHMETVGSTAPCITTTAKESENVSNNVLKDIPKEAVITGDSNHDYSNDNADANMTRGDTEKCNNISFEKVSVEKEKDSVEVNNKNKEGEGELEEEDDDGAVEDAEAGLWCFYCLDDETIPFCAFCGCRNCFGKNDTDYLIICDGCEVESHLYCLAPMLLEVPVDDWYCRDCLLRGGKEEDEEEDEEVEEEEEERRMDRSQSGQGGDSTASGKPIRRRGPGRPKGGTKACHYFEDDDPPYSPLRFQSSGAAHGGSRRGRGRPPGAAKRVAENSNMAANRAGRSASSSAYSGYLGLGLGGEPVGEYDAHRPWSACSGGQSIDGSGPRFPVPLATALLVASRMSGSMPMTAADKILLACHRKDECTSIEDLKAVLLALMDQKQKLEARLTSKEGAEAEERKGLLSSKDCLLSEPEIPLMALTPECTRILSEDVAILDSIEDAAL